MKRIILVQNLPPGMVETFRNRTKKKKRMESANEADDSLQDLLYQGMDKRAKFSTKSRTARGTFAKKSVEELSNADKKMPHIVHSWRNYVRYFFDQHPGFKASCCGKSYDKTETFLTHRLSLHVT